MVQTTPCIPGSPGLPSAGHCGPRRAPAPRPSSPSYSGQQDHLPFQKGVTGACKDHHVGESQCGWERLGVLGPPK